MEFLLINHKLKEEFKMKQMQWINFGSVTAEAEILTNPNYTTVINRHASTSKSARYL